MKTSPYNLRTLAANSSQAFILKMLHVPLVFLTNLVIARLFGPKLMGVYFIALNIVAITSALCKLGLDVGLLRFTAALKSEGRSGDLKRMFWQASALAVTLSGLVALGIYASSHWLADYFHAPKLPRVLNYMALALPISVITSLAYEAVRGWGRALRVVFQKDVLSNVGFLFFLTILAYAGSDFITRSRVLGLAFLLNAILGLIFIAPSLDFVLRPAKPVEPHHSPLDLFKYSGPLFLMTMLNLGFGEVDSLLLGLFTNPMDVAFYGVAVKTMVLISLPLFAVNAIVPQLFAEFHQRGDHRGLETIGQTTARWTYYFALPLTLLTIILGPEILSLFGAEFTKARMALTVLCLAQLVNVGAGSVAFILMMTGNQWALIRMQILTGAITLPLMAICAATYGINGLACARAVGIAGINILAAVAVWRCLKIKAFARKVQWANLGGVLGTSLFYLTDHHFGKVWATAFFILGYAVILAKPLMSEYGEIMQLSPYELLK